MPSEEMYELKEKYGSWSEIPWEEYCKTEEARKTQREIMIKEGEGQCVK